jgi:RimJ/RimL family protein N-acetyltransferase
MIILETERLSFRHHEEADLEPFCEMEADPEFRRLSGGRPRPREEAERVFRETWLRPKPMGLLATVFKRRTATSAAVASIRTGEKMTE